MKVKSIQTCVAATLLAISAACGLTQAEPLIKEGDVVGIVGDSITEQKQYSVFIEDYLLMCQPTKVRAINFGWSGEQVYGLNARIVDLLAFKPTVYTTCYGMNDGHYMQVTDDIRRMYRENSEKMVKTFVDSGAKVLVGSPGAVDTDSFKRPNVDPATYNINLDCLRAEAKYVASEFNQPFADVHTPMIDVMKQLKAKYGEKFQVCGGDGVHPGPDGHLIMAYAFLKGLGFDGNIGEFDVDLAAHTANVTGGHKLVKIDGNAVTIESTQYPFCFFGKMGDQNGTLATTEFLPFNQDLNRLTLKVTGPDAKYKVTWGNGSKTYTADELKAGVNLAADFPDNPFATTFQSVSTQVLQKQSAETALIKNLLRSMNASAQYLPSDKDKEAIAQLTESIKKRDETLATETRAWVKPLTHTITIEAAQ